ncbi:hypothetical protein H310_02262 [Aphanomyces invadans]|uniref:Uncharacterized protein n=1 Tax=Aphanomyces invadans TaxID=157072 RepID=A0A024UNG2_9STRA|nr:hypothetical protein H310_02262 [Aphanomyces invadans]ETW07839.1 hypothetical protein H310_02262 [Aphanomyces invadans]|eukprot:XP_008863932.1 hypothetical protein H310_02262 [Aphanomyces invadans]
MARAQNFDNASIDEINAAIDKTATKIRELRDKKQNMADIALEVKQLVTLRRLLKEKVEGGGQQVGSQGTAPVTPVKSEENAETKPVIVKPPTDEQVKRVETAPVASKPTVSSPDVATEAPETPAKTVLASANDNDKTISSLESELAATVAKLGSEQTRATSLQEELNRQVQKYDIEITTSNNMQQRLQNDMKKLVQDKLELERSLRVAKEAHAAALSAANDALQATQDSLAKESQSFLILKAAEAESQQEVATLKAKLADTQDRVTQLTSELDTLRNHSREQGSLLQQAQRELERERVRFEMELDAEKKLQTRMHNEARRYSLERQSSMDQLKATLTEAEKLQASLAETTAANAELQDSIVRLEAERATSQGLLKTLASDVQAQKTELDRFEKAQAEWEVEKQHLESQAASHDATKAKLKAMEAHNTELQALISTTGTETKALEAKLAKLHAAQDALTAEKESLLHHVTKTEADLEALARIQKENDELQRAINDMSKASESTHEKMDGLKRALKTLESEKAGLLHHATTNDVHEATIAQLMLENTQLRSTVTDKVAAAEAAVKRMTVAESKLQDTQYMMTTEMLKVASLEKHVVKLQTDLSTVTTQHTADLRAKEAEAKKAVADFQAAEAALSQLQRSTEKASNNIAAKDEALKAAKASAAALRTQVVEAKNELVNVQGALKQAQADLKAATKGDKDEAARLRKENGKLADVIAQLRKSAKDTQDSQAVVKSLETQRLLLIGVLVALVGVLAAATFSKSSA